MSTAVHLRLTAQEYLERERVAETKSEFVDGEVFAMSGGTYRHSQLAVQFVRHLSNALEGRPCRVFNSDLRVRTPVSGSYHYPDASALCGPINFEDDKEDIILNPSLIAEVLAPSTENYDRGMKSVYYRSIASLTDYVLVSSDCRRVEHWHRQSGDTWLLTTYREADDTLTLPSVGATLRVGDLYSGLDFSADEA